MRNLISIEFLELTLQFVVFSSPYHPNIVFRYMFYRSYPLFSNKPTYAQKFNTYQYTPHKRFLAVSEFYRVYNSHGCVQNVESLVTVILSITELHVMYETPLSRIRVPYHGLVLK